MLQKYGPLQLLTSFSTIAGCNFLGKKTEKPLNTLDERNWKTAIIVDENQKPKTKFEKTRKPWKALKPKNRSF